jgi:hypothetical protein
MTTPRFRGSLDWSSGVMLPVDFKLKWTGTCWSAMPDKMKIVDFLVLSGVDIRKPQVGWEIDESCRISSPLEIQLYTSPQFFIGIIYNS